MGIHTIANMANSGLAYINYLKNNKFLFIIPICIAFLNIIGLLILSSASLSFIHFNYLSRQFCWLLFALAGLFLGLWIPLDRLKRHANIIYYLSLSALLIILIPGVGLDINGSRRWIDLGFFHLQVSEFSKLALVLFLANYLARIGADHPSLTNGFFKPLLATFGLVGPILLEPDYGMTALFLCVALIILFLNGLSVRTLLFSGILLLLIFAIFIALNPVRLNRIRSFLNIEETKLSGSYQLWQGLTAFKIGGVERSGLGQGIQQLFYLPEAHTDFIFAILAEELGYWIAALVILAYALIFIATFVEIYRVHDQFLFLLGAGIIAFITVQAAINLAVVMGLSPTKGMALPFISYGGSNLIVTYLMIGLLFNTFKSAYYNRDISKEEMEKLSFWRSKAR